MVTQHIHIHISHIYIQHRNWQSGGAATINGGNAGTELILKSRGGVMCSTGTEYWIWGREGWINCVVM